MSNPWLSNQALTEILQCREFVDVIKVLGCHSPFWLLQQKPETGWLIKFCFVLNKIVFLAVLKIKVLADSVSDSEMAPSSCDLTRGRSKGALWGLFLRDTRPTQEALTSWLNHPVVALPPNAFTLGLRFPHMNFKGHRHSELKIGRLSSIIWMCPS